MDDDEYNDFEQAGEIPQEIQPENSGKEQEQVEEQTGLAQNQLPANDPLLINPSSYLAAKSIQSPNADIEIKDFEGASQPHLNKIQSENLASPQDVFFNLDKNYPRSEPNIELIDYTNVHFLQEKNLFTEILADRVEDSTFQNLEKTDLDQKIKIQKDVQQNESYRKEQLNLDLQKLDKSEEINHEDKVEQQVKENQQQIENHQQQSQKQQVFFNANNNQQEHKETENYKEQQQFNNQQINQQQQEQKQQQQEDDQFGDFQQTVPNTEQTTDSQIQHVQITSQQQEYPAQIPKNYQAPQSMNKRTRQQQLEQFVNSLPDYSFLFLQAFQSF